MTSKTRRISSDQWWKRLNNEVEACDKCDRLVQHCRETASAKRAAYRDQEYWGKPVPNFGDPSARLLIVGLAPGAHGANRTGRMFTGDRSGDWLYRALYKGGFASQAVSSAANDGMQLTDCVITNACHCAPPGNKPLPQEVRTCSEWFLQLVHKLPVTVIVALGGLAWNAVWQQIGAEQSSSVNASKPASTFTKKTRPKFGHGAETQLTSSIVMIGSYHPSQQNTFTGRLTEPMLDQIIIRAKELLGS